MSLAKFVFPSLGWGEIACILSFLSDRETWMLGHGNRSGFITFLREKTLREIPSNLLTQTRFLSKCSDHEKVLLVSYPRSGNSFLRKLLETATSIVTGSDSRPNRTLSASLLRCGYKGEGITDSSVWVVKSHYPERLGYIRFAARRVILLVRNPFDSIESYFHMGMTNTHDKSLSGEAFSRLSSQWRECVANEAAVWASFHAYWSTLAGSVPVLLVRYEDLLASRQETMADVLEFMREGRAPAGLSRYMNTTENGGKNSTGDSSSTCGHIAAVDTVTAAGPAGYQPKKKVSGKALQAMEAEGVLGVVRATGRFLAEYGYEVEVGADQNQPQFGLKVLPMRDAATGKTVYSRRLAAAGIEGQPLPAESEACHSGSVWVNDRLSIRPETDQFGRKFTDLRRSLTADDTQPFQTA